MTGRMTLGRIDSGRRCGGEDWRLSNRHDMHPKLRSNSHEELDKRLEKGSEFYDLSKEGGLRYHMRRMGIMKGW
jgi:hypothetical protein